MNSEVTLTNYSTSVSCEGYVRLMYRRRDPRNAVLLEHEVPRYFLATSHDGTSKIRIRDAAQNKFAEVKRRNVAKDVFKFANRYDGKAVKVKSILRRVPSTDDREKSMALDAPDGLYYWRKSTTRQLTLCKESSSTPVAWTEYVPGPSPTWALIINSQVENILDYVLASLFYVKYELSSDRGWENVDSRALYLSTR